MDTNQIIYMLSSKEVVGFLFKAFAIVISIMYLLYSIVISKQTEVMNKVLEAKGNYILHFVASLQITLGFILIILSIFLL